MKKTLLLLSILLISSAALRAERPDSVSRLEKSLSALRSRACGGDPKALFDLSSLLEKGFATVLRDSLRADSLLRLSAAAGYPPAISYLGFRTYLSDPAQGISLMEKAVALGDPKAASNLGYILAWGDSLRRDYPKAISLLSQAAAKDLPVAVTLLADIYREGRGVAPDTLRAAGLYDKALRLHFRDAEPKLLAMIYPSFASLPASEAVAKGLDYYNLGAFTIGVTLFEHAASLGDAHAMALLGDAYSRARGVPYSHDKSLRCFFDAARLGNPSARFIISELLEIYPDALDPLIVDTGLASPDADASPTADSSIGADLRDPRYWRRLAEADGVADAETANLLLLGKKQ